MTIVFKMFFRDNAKERIRWTKDMLLRPNVYKPFAILIVIFGLLELSGFAVLANYSVILIKVMIYQF